MLENLNEQLNEKIDTLAYFAHWKATKKMYIYQTIVIWQNDFWPTVHGS